MKKTAIIAFVIMLVTVIIAGCGGGSKETVFSQDGLTITLNNRFTDDTETEAGSNNISFSSDKDGVSIRAFKDNFASVEAAGLSTGMSLTEYAQLIIDGNQRDSIVKTHEGLTYFEFVSNGLSNLYVIYKGTDAFWIVQFIVSSENYGNMFNDLMTWAKSVEV